MTINWNKDFGRELGREIERSLKDVQIPVRMTDMDIEDLDEESRRILLYLDEQCKGRPQYIDYRDVARQLKLTDERVSITYDRLEQAGYVDLAKSQGGMIQAVISRDGKVAADDLRRLPERQREREEVAARVHRRSIWALYHEKFLVPLLVGTILLLAGLLVRSECASTPDPPSDTSNGSQLENSP